MAVIKFSPSSFIKTTYKSYRAYLSKLVKICKVSGGMFGLVLQKKNEKPKLQVITRISDPKHLAKKIQGYKLISVNRDCSDLESAITMNFWSSDRNLCWSRTDPDCYFSRKDMIIFDVWTDIEGRTRNTAKGMPFNRICKECVGEPEEIVQAIDFMIRSGILLKLPSGGIWTAENYWKKVMEIGQIIWLSPGHYVRDGMVARKRRIYGKNARKNFAPQKMGLA